MKIAVMMRAMDQDSGFHMYVDGLLEAMLSFEPSITFLLLYRTTKYFGRFKSFSNAREILLKSRNKLFWDQVLVPFAARKYKADIIFNPKFTVPIFSHRPVIMGLQEPAWYVCPEYYEKFDVLYQKFMLPIYIRKASHFLPMANWVVEENRKYLNHHFQNSTITYPGVHKSHKPVTDQIVLSEFRKRYQLPEKFILSMTRVTNPGMENSKKWNPSQNPDTILKSFMLCRDKIPHHLVMAGKHVREYFLDNRYTNSDFEKVHFVNFVPFNEIQNLYSLASLIVIPVFYESFSFTLLGAMACGCPAVVSTTGAFQEVVGDGALYADPYSPEDFASKIEILLNNDELRNRLIKNSFERASYYTWENAAKKTLEAIKNVVNK